MGTDWKDRGAKEREPASPGPWDWRDEGGRYAVLEDARGGYVLGHAVEAWEITVADSRLLAAAPELLALMREWAGALDLDEPSLRVRTRALLTRIDTGSGKP